MEWKLNSGVLIVGSLLWQDYAHDKGDNIRLNWRNTRLSLADKIAVKVPIRYGRLSGAKNSEIPTMIFSNRMKNKLGIAYAVPFKSTINNYDQLLCEAMALSAAEGMKGNFVKNWGVLAYLLNKNKIDAGIKKEIIKLFRKRKNQSFKPQEYKVGREKSCVTSSQKLEISWPQALIPSDQEKLNRFDFLLSTATNPENNEITLDSIAEKIIADKDRRYFLNNISNGIITYEDFDIAKKFK